MHKYLLILTLAAFVSSANAQRDLSIVGNVVSAYLDAASEADDNTRKKGYESILTEKAMITAVLLQENGASNTTAGTWQKFIEDSQPFYSSYSVRFVEQEREVDYYLDLASVHLIVDQFSAEKASGKVFEQRLWLQLDLIFVRDRWYVSNVIWINQGKRNISNVLAADTLVRVP